MLMSFRILESINKIDDTHSMACRINQTHIHKSSFSYWWSATIYFTLFVTSIDLPKRQQIRWKKIMEQRSFNHKFQNFSRIKHLYYLRSCILLKFCSIIKFTNDLAIIFSYILSSMNGSKNQNHTLTKQAQIIWWWC